MSSLLQLPFSYLLWHYVLAWSDLVRLYKNFTWFLWNFFSIPLLLRTLFSPWKRLHEGANKESAGFLGKLILNTILRFIGFGMRVCTILFGLCSLVLFSVLFAFFLVLWPLMPPIIIACLLFGFVEVVTF